MATKSAEEKLEYILTCLKNCGEIKPDYHAVAAEKSLSSANNAQKAFKKYIEDAGFKLVNGQILAGDGSGTVAPITPKKTPAKRGRAPKQTPKKATGNENSSDDAEVDDDADKKPSIKKRKVEANEKAIKTPKSEVDGDGEAV